MASSIDFPSTLPKPAGGTFRETTKEPWVNDPSAVGSARRRARFTRALRRFAYRTIVSSAQKAILETFYDTTLSNGVLSFNWTHPVTSTSYEVVFSGRPPFSHMQGDYYSVEIGLEAL